MESGQSGGRMKPGNVVYEIRSGGKREAVNEYEEKKLNPGKKP